MHALVGRAAALCMLAFLSLVGDGYVLAQPGEGIACVVSAGNRNAPLAPDGTYTIFGIPGDLGAVRARATCSDGSFGQSGMQFTNPNEEAVLDLGPIEFGRLDPVPVAVHLSAPDPRLTTGQTAQMQLLAVGVDGQQWDATLRSAGTTYYLSNRLLASVSDDGLVTIHPLFAPGSSARVLAGATAEGSVTSTMMFTLGPRGQLAGRVLRADGTTPVAAAQVSVIRLQPMEAAGTAVTNGAGEFLLAEVNAGGFLVSAIDPGTGDRALAMARIEHEGETAQVELRMNGLAAVNATVIDAEDQIVAGALVTYTALGAYRTVRNLETSAAGVAAFAGIPAGDFTVSTRDPVTRLIGAAVAHVEPGQTLDLVLRLQPVGQIEGRVLDTDGETPVAGVQVRVASRERGILTQSITAGDGAFAFDSLPLSDGPYTLDAFVGGRLRARVPGVVLSQPNQTVQRDIVFGPIGTVGGQVRTPAGVGQPYAQVTLQSLDGLNLRFERAADAQGRFAFSAVPVGEFELTAVTAEGRTGRSAGTVGGNGEHVELDVVVAEDTLVGQVFQRDGVTPVGAGVAVYLAPRSIGLQYSLAGHPSALSTQTDAQGRYGFSVPGANTWVVQAEQDLERGRSQVVVVNLNPSQPLVADLVFLAKGSVSGTVRDSGGAVQANVPVSIRTQGAFVAERLTQTDALGRYTLDGVFAGDVSAFASNPQTQLSGIAHGRLDAEGQAIVLDVTLYATGTIQGQVLLREGGAVPDPVRISLRRNGALVQTLELPDGQQYRFDAVPLGDIRIEAERLGNGDRGLATTRLNAAGEVKTLPVRLVGQAVIEVDLIDEGGLPVAGARVVLSQSTPFPLTLERHSDAQGRVRFDHVYAGDFSISASKPAQVGRLSGSAAGTLLPGEDQQVQILMRALAYGRIAGTVFEPDGLTPAGAGKIVRMLPEPFPNAFVTVTDGNGQYAFDPVDAGSYTIDVLNFFVPGTGACPNRDRIRGRATGVTLSEQGEEVEADVQLIGQGRVGGVVVNAQGQPVAGIEIRLTNPDPVYGANVSCNGRTTFDTFTNANGEYLLPDVPPGDFTMTAENATRTMRAEAQGRVRFDGDEVELDLVLIDSAITMPHTFYDANGFRFDIQGTGSIGTGTNNVFEGSGPDNAGMRLELIHNGIPVPFLNGDGSIGRLDVDGQQVELDDSTPSGLFVTRRVRAPRAGYFSRYLEILENPTEAPVTVSVRVRSHHRSAQSTPRVVDTSDGDQVLSVSDPDNPDRWAVIDDQVDGDPFPTSASIPATGHLFDGAGAAARVGLASYELIGTAGRLTYQWNDVTVPAGGRVILMHFAFHQLDREAAREAATRLVLLPPEAIEDLTTDERADVLNFAVPEQSPLPPLPNLDAGELTGTVFSGDGLTPVPGARVRFKSLHPLFGRQRFVDTAADGGFLYRSTLTGTATNYVIPVYAFELSATYPRSGAQSALAQGDFELGQVQTEQDLLFFSTGDVTGVVERHNGALVADARVNLCRLNSPSCTNVQPNPDNHAYSGADGRYHLLASEPRDYFLFARKAHPQRYSSSGRDIHGEGTVTVTAGDTAIANITMEATGSIAGFVRAPDGTTVVNARVDLYLEGSPSIARTTTTDTAGFYRLFDVPLGSHRVRARDTISGAEGETQAIVAIDIETQADITLSGFGALRVQVQFARGLAAGNAPVQVLGTSVSGTADSNGQITFQLPQGSYEVRARHPDSSHLIALAGQASATIETLGQQVDVLVVLQPAGAVLGTIVRPDGTTLAGGFPYVVRQIRGGNAAWHNRNTDNTGNYRVPGLPVGGYVITAYDPAQDRYADAEFDVSEDGEEVVVNLVLLENRIPLPATLRDANRFAFDVQHSGALAQGDAAFHNAGVSLEINGQPFTGETSARLEADRRQFAIEQPGGIDGLLVTRRIYVPRGAYFARYIETLENPTAAPIQATVRLSTRFAGGQVRSTSSGDTIVDTNDHWLMVDDGVDADIRLYPGQPATVHVWGHPQAGAMAPTAVVLDVSDDRPRLRQTWQDVVVPPGGQVSLVHFLVQQIHRNGSLVAAERLLDLPPEVLTDLPPGALEGSLNFVLPADGQGELEPLPSLTGGVNGIAFEGDERTPVRGARITVQSTHPLFNRVWGKRADPVWDCGPGTPVPSLISLVQSPGGVTDPPPEGSYGLQGQLTAEDSIALPEGVEVRVVAQESAPCYGYYAGHPFTRYPSRAEIVVPSVEHDVIWDTGVLTGTVVGSHDFSVTGGRLYRSIDDPDPPYPVYVPIASDATYVYPGLPPGQYDLLFDTQHPQGSGSQGGLLRGQRTNVEVTLGAITVTDLSMQPTGSLQGTLVKATGEPARDAQMILEGLAAGQVYDQCASGCVEATLTKHKGKRLVRRQVLTDSLGRYSFAAVPAGSYTLTAIDPVSDGRVTVALDVDADQVGIQNMILLALGSADLQVRKQSGAVVVDAIVYLNAASAGGERVAGRTNGAGQLTIANIPEGGYTLRIRDPRHPVALMDRSVSGTITAAGQVDQHEVTLLAAATLQVQVIDGDNGGQPVAGATVWVRDVHSERLFGTTNAQGQVNAAPVLAGSYTVRARATINNVVKEEQVTGSLTNANDEQTVPVQVDLRSAVVSLPRTLYDANRQAYTVQADGGASRMPRLRINQQNFTGAATAVQQLAQRQLRIEQVEPIAGLHVSRRVFTPRNGYFARYVEVLENRGTSPITVDVSVQTQAWWQHNVLMTSSGDNVLDSSGADPDRWFTIGGTPTAAARAFVFSAPEGDLPAPVLHYSPQVGTSDRTASATWSGLTVPPGERVLLMHFDIEQVHPAAALAAAERLYLLPPEAIEGLAGDDALDIGNFGVPEDGISAVEPLPDLEGIVLGRVLEGDGVTPVASTTVRLRSLHPLFPLEWTRTSNAAGDYTHAGILHDTSQTVAVPVGTGVAMSAQHPRTGMVWTGTADFEPDQDTALQDIVFDSGSVFGEITGAFQTTVSSGTVRAYLGSTEVGNTSVNNQGRFSLGGLDAGTYRLTASVNLSGVSGTQITGEVLEVVIATGERVEQDIALVPNGGLTGRVFTFVGDPRSNQTVQLRHVGSTFQRSATTNSLGRYTLNGVPAGDYIVSVTDQATSAFVAADVVIVADEATEQDLVLHGVGQVTATMLYARGDPVSGRSFTLTAPSISGSVTRGPTDAQGRRTFPVAVGPYTLSATHPQTSQASEVQGVVAAHGEASTIELVLAASASLRVRVVDAENGSLPIAGVRVTYTRADTGASQQSGLTDADGWVQISNLRETSYALVAYAPDGRRGSGSFIVDADVDGELVEQTLSIQPKGETEDSFSFGQERHLYSLHAEVGETIAISIRSSSNCEVRVQVYGPNNNLLAAGYGRGPNGNFGQINEQGDLRQVPVAVSGQYTVAVSPRVTSCFNTGYFLSATVSGELADLLPYQGSNRIHGRLLRPDGATPVVGGLVRLRVTTAPQIGVQQLSDDTGAFDFTALPSGNFTLEYVPEAGSQQAVQHIGWMSVGEQIEHDLILPAMTTVLVTVLDEQDQPVGSNVQVRFRPEGSFWTNRWTNASGQVGYVHIGNSMLTVRAMHPSLANVFDQAQVAADDGQTIELTLTPRPATVTGRLLDPDGNVLIDRWVYVDVAGSSENLRSQRSDAQGRFEFTNVPADQALDLRAADPFNGVATRVGINVPHGQSLSQDVQLVGRGSVYGRVTMANGEPVTHRSLHVHYTYDEGLGYTTSSWGQTDEHGEYRIEYLPVGRDLDVEMSIYWGGDTHTESATVQIAGHGDELQQDLQFDLQAGALRVRVLGSDGDRAEGWCEVYLWASGGGDHQPEHGEGGGGDGWRSGPCAEDLLFAPLQPGAVTAYGYAGDLYLEDREVTIVAGETAELDYAFPVVRGTVRYADGVAADDASVRLEQFDNEIGYTQTGIDGRYRLLGLDLGEFLVTATDYLSGLAVGMPGELTDAAEPVTVDLTLPASGLIEGTVLDHDGQPVADALVLARSHGLAFDRETYTDHEGLFAFDRIAVGSVELAALHPAHALVASGVVTLEQADQLVQADLQFPLPASMQGVVLTAQGDPADERCVHVISTEQGLGYERLEQSTETGSDGAFAFQVVAPGHFELRADACPSVPHGGQGLSGAGDASAAVHEGLLAAGTNVEVTLQLGTAIATDAIALADAVSAYTLRPWYDGSAWQALPSDGNWNLAYESAHGLRVNGIEFPRRDSGVLLNDGREIGFSSQGMGGIRVSRRFHVPANGGYARSFDRFSNLGSDPAQITVRYEGRRRYSDDPWLVLPDSNGDRYALHGPGDPSWFWASGNAGHVFAGAGGAVPVAFDLDPDRNAFGWAWTLTLAPGQTLGLLHYSVPRLPGEGAAAQTQTEALSAMNVDGMFDGLNAVERAQVYNFQVPQP